MYAQMNRDSFNSEDAVSNYNRRVMILFSAIMFVIDASAFIGIYAMGQIRVEHQLKSFGIINGIYLLCLIFGLALYYWGTKKHQPLLGSLLFTMILSYRLTTLFVLDNLSLVLVVYVGLFGIISTTFYLKYELFYASIATQSVLAYYLSYSGMPLYDALAILFFVTLIILCLIYITYRSRITYLETDRLKMDSIQTGLMLENMINQLDEMIVIVDMHAKFVVFNNSFKRHTGFNDESDFKKFVLAIGEKQYLQMLEAIAKTIEAQEKQYIDSVEFVSDSQQVYYFSLTFHPFNYSEQKQVLIEATNYTKERNLSLVKDLVIEMNHMLITTHSLKEYFDYVLKRLMDTNQRADLGTVLILGEDDMFSIVASCGYDDAFVKSFKLHLKEAYFSRLNPSQERRPMIINDIDQLDMVGFTQLSENEKHLSVYSTLTCPIFLNDQLHGLINLDSSKTNVYNDTDLEVMFFLMDQMSFVVGAFYLQEQTRYLSIYDQLTGLYNRWYLDQITNKVIPNCLRHNMNFALMVIDLNNLKKINDEFGHDIGDAYLVEASNLFKNRIRQSDIMIRIGGDEFVIVFYSAIMEDCEHALSDISVTLDEVMLNYNVPTGVCALAFGGAVFPTEGDDLHSLLRLADERMYCHKRLIKSK